MDLKKLEANCLQKGIGIEYWNPWLKNLVHEEFCFVRDMQ